MNVTIICDDCGRKMGTQVLLGKKQDREIRVHACFHNEQGYGEDKEIVPGKATTDPCRDLWR